MDAKMRRFQNLRRLALACLILIVACSQGDEESEASSDELYQISTLAALSAGGYDGLIDFDELLEHGDFGLGTFDALDGELIVLDGVAYQVPADGVPVEVEGSVTTPFAVVTNWEADTVFEVEDPLSCADLEAAIDTELESLNSPYAIKVSGDFETMTTRSEDRQDKPYAPLSAVLEDQIEFELPAVSATMVGFRLPDYMAESNAAGYHFHAVTKDLTAGGHVLDCQTTSVTVELDLMDSWLVELP